MRTISTLVLLLLLAFPVFADDKGHDAKELSPTDIVYKPDPAFPGETRTAVVYGDPSKPGLFILRIKFPPNFIVPPHTHPVFESVTVLSGSMGSGMGKTVDKSSGKILEAGGILLLPADHVHYVWTEDKETVIQVSGNGPFDLTYIDPKQDPRNQ